jgi:hypothetical protein
VRLYQTLCSSPPTAWISCADSTLCFDYSCIRTSKEFGSATHMLHGVRVQSSCIRSSRKDSVLSRVPLCLCRR